MSSAIRHLEPESQEADPSRTEIARLVTLVRDCQRAGIARQACMIRLSAQCHDHKLPLQVRLAREAVEPLTKADRAQLFDLPGRDMVLIWRGPADTALASARTAIEHLFDDDRDASASSGLWTEFHLPEDTDRLLSAIAETLAPKKATPVPPAETNALNTHVLAAMETALVRADVAPFARRRDICRRLPDGTFQRCWEKRFLSVEEITQSLAPGHAARFDPWLFQRLTRTLDRRMLVLLSSAGEMRDAGPFAINLNVASILAPEFLRLDESLPGHLRGHVVLDLAPADILSDPAAFVFARDFARSRGYRLMLRNVTADLLAVFQLGRIGLDLMELRWSDTLGRIDRDMVLTDARNIVLSHADTPDAIAWGLAHDIPLYQGAMALPDRSRAARLAAG